MNNNEFLLIPVFICLILFIFTELKILLFKRNIFYWFLIIITGIMSGLRVDVGRDYSIYKSFFSGGIPVNVSEFFFLKFANISAYYDDTGKLGFLISALITCIGYGYFINKFMNKQRYLAFLAFLCIPVFYISSFNLVRQQLAIGLGLIVMSYFINKRELKKSNHIIMIICITFISMIHYGSICYIGLYIIIATNKNSEKWIRISVLFISILFIINYRYLEQYLIQSSIYGYYSGHISENNAITLYGYLFVSLFAGIIYKYKKIKSITSSTIYIIPVIICITLCIVWATSSLSNFWLRLSQFIFPFTLISLIKCIYLLNAKDSTVFIRLAASLGFAAIYILKWIQDSSFGFYSDA